MQFKRMFSTDAYKGTSGYLRTQKNYEILRTVLYFAISLSLFIAGWVTTGSRENLLTIVAVLGCLCSYAIRGVTNRMLRRLPHIPTALPDFMIWCLPPMRKIM